jgi:hypothetical protein
MTLKNCFLQKSGRECICKAASTTYFFGTGQASLTYCRKIIHRIIDPSILSVALTPGYFVTMDIWFDADPL